MTREWLGNTLGIQVEFGIWQTAYVMGCGDLVTSSALHQFTCASCNEKWNIKGWEVVLFNDVDIHLLVWPDRCTVNGKLVDVGWLDSSCILPTSGMPSESLHDVLVANYTLSRNERGVCCESHWTNQWILHANKTHNKGLSHEMELVWTAFQLETTCHNTIPFHWLLCIGTTTMCLHKFKVIIWKNVKNTCFCAMVYVGVIEVLRVLVIDKDGMSSNPLWWDRRSNHPYNAWADGCSTNQNPTLEVHSPSALMSDKQ